MRSFTFADWGIDMRPIEPPTIICGGCERRLPLDAFWRCEANINRHCRQRLCKPCHNDAIGREPAARFREAGPLLFFLASRGVRSRRQQAAALGVSDRQVARYRAGAVMRASTADRCATALGLHPSAIW